MAKISEEQLNQVMQFCYANLKNELAETLRTGRTPELKTRRNTHGGFNGTLRNIIEDECGIIIVDENSNEERIPLNMKFEKRDENGGCTITHQATLTAPKESSGGKKFIKHLTNIRVRYQQGFTMHALEHVINGTYIERVFWTLKLCLAITVALYLSWQLFEGGLFTLTLRFSLVDAIFIGNAWLPEL